MPLAVLLAKAAGGDAVAQRTAGIHYLSHETLLPDGQRALADREARSRAGALTAADKKGLTALSGLHPDAAEAEGARWLALGAEQGDIEVRQHFDKQNLT